MVLLKERYYCHSRGATASAQPSTELTTVPRNSRVGVEGVVLDDD